MGNIPSWSNKLIKIRSGGGDDWSKFTETEAGELMNVVKRTPAALNEIKGLIKNFNIEDIKEKFKKFFKNKDERDMAKKRIGWFLLSAADQKKSLDDFY